MARMPRVRSGSGYYHVVCRGVGRQILFEDDEDYERYLGALRRFLPENAIELVAYCLMDNHVHLLLHADSGLERAMKQISVSYSHYFNTKYERAGHLFQDRYMSEPIEDEAYLLTVVRYIHNNPQKAGICRHDEYRWSSWREYVEEQDITAPGLVLELVGGVERFVEFSEGDDAERHLEIADRRRLSDARAIECIRKELNLESGTQLQAMARADRDCALRLLKERGLTVRQIERLTGVNRGAIQRA